MTSRIAPCEQRLREVVLVLEEIKSKDPSFYYEALGQFALKDYWVFLRLILNYDWMDPWFHGEVLCKFISDNVEEDICLLLPRGAGKTGALTIPRPAWLLANDPLKSILICNAAGDKANQMMRATAKMIANNEIYRACFPWVRPSAKWGDRGYMLDMSVVPGTSFSSVDRVDYSLGAYGIKGNITGAHVGALLLDDLINAEMADSYIRLKDAESFFSEALRCLDPGSPCFVCGTRWVYHDYYGKLISGELIGNNGKFKVLKLGVYSDDLESFIWPQRTYIDIRGNERKAGYTEKYIAAQKKNEGARFSALYLNEPVTDDDVQFELSQIETYSNLPFDLGPVAMCVMEAESQGNALYSVAWKMSKDEGRRVPIQKIKSKGINKDSRIKSTLQPIIANGQLVIRDDLFRNDSSIGGELRAYPKGYDDCIDALVYSIKTAVPSGDDLLPRIYIALDPAFSISKDSDHSAIVATCIYRDKYWVLACERFKTDKADVCVRRLFRMIDIFENRTSHLINNKKSAYIGFRSDIKDKKDKHLNYPTCEFQHPNRVDKHADNRTFKFKMRGK